MIFVIHNKVITIKIPGKKITHQELVSKARLAKESMLPQDIISTGNPRPKN